MTPRIEDPFGPDGSMNSHVYTLKNGNQVRMVGRIVKNGSKVTRSCVLGILRGQTFNKARPKRTGQVSYAFRFLSK